MLISSPELIHTVLVEQADRFEKNPRFRHVMEPILGNGLVTSENTFHKRQRQLVAPAFQHRQLASLVPLMAQAAEHLQNQWQDGEVIDLAPQMMQVTLQIVGKALFTADLLGEAQELGKAITLAIRHTSAELMRMMPLPSPLSGFRQRHYQEAVKRLDQTVDRLITGRRTETSAPDDLLTLLLEARDQDDGQGMTNQQLRDEVMTLLQAGHETTANALSWAWYLHAL